MSSARKNSRKRVLKHVGRESGQILHRGCTRDFLVIALLLVILTFAVYAQILNYGFVDWDDDDYVTANLSVQGGLSVKSLVWAFRTTEAANWHPLTWLSHMLDCHLYGLNAGCHHFTSLLFHILNSLLLFYVLARATGAVWRSGFVAALFAVHPLHVESVAWIAERKDVLSTFFWFATMLAYFWYTERPSSKRYLLVLLFFALGLLSKPMLVTLPVVLLLWDYWPLRRIGVGNEAKKSTFTDWCRIVVEKVPLLLLSGAMSWVTLYAQRAGGAIIARTAVDIGDRLSNALISYCKYLVMMVYPKGLAAFYPYHRPIPLIQVLAAMLFLIGMSVVVMVFRRRRSYLVTGWFWYLITLLPVIGLVQVGSQAMADRYTYVPLTGIFLVVTWWVADSLSYRRTLAMRYVVVAIALAVILGLSLCARAQVTTWRSDFSLWTHALSNTSRNDFAHYNLGVELLKRGKFAEAEKHFSASLKINPNQADAENGLGSALHGQGKFEDALVHYRLAVKLDSKLPEARKNLANMLLASGRLNEALPHFEIALKLDPTSADMHAGIGYIFLSKGEYEKAVEHYKLSFRYGSPSAGAYNNLGLALERLGKYDEARAYFEAALKLDSKCLQAQENLERISAKLK